MRSHLELQAGRQLFGQIGRQVDDRLLDIRARQGDHWLTGTDGLPSFSLPVGDHCGMIGLELTVAQLVARLGNGGPGLLQRSTGGLQIGLGSVQLRLGADAAIEQLLLATRIGLGVDPLCLDLGQIALGSTQLVALISRIQAGQCIARFHFAADIHPAPGDTTGHAKAQGALVARLNSAGKPPETGLCLRLHDHRQYRADRIGLCGLLFTTGQQQHAAQAQYDCFHCATPLSLSGAISTCIPGVSNCPPATTTVSPPLRPSAMTTLPVR
ncbi:hypothetical protein D3C78_834910 [compost metagenome]